VSSSITISALTTILAPGGTTEVTAYVVEEVGTPVHDGTTVVFQSSLGTMSPVEAQTHNGLAHATFTAGQATGTARITAQSGAAVAGDGGNVVEIVISSTPTATVGLTVTPTNPTVGQAVTLSVNPTIASGGNPPRVTVAWGDGSTTDLGVVAANRETTHVYNTVGTFTIAATAVAEGTSTSSTSVVVTAAGAISVNVTGSPSVPARCSAVTFTANATFPLGDTTSVARYEWNIASATSSENENVTTTGNSLTRVFRTIGTKTVSVTAVATDGRQGNGQTQIVVRELTGTEVCN
jgi:hypothetical protein